MESNKRRLEDEDEQQQEEHNGDGAQEESNNDSDSNNNDSSDSTALVVKKQKTDGQIVAVPNDERSKALTVSFWNPSSLVFNESFELMIISSPFQEPQTYKHQLCF